MLDDGHGLSSQDGLVNPKSGGEDLDQPDVGGDLVSDCNHDKSLKSSLRYQVATIIATNSDVIGIYKSFKYKLYNLG